MTAMLPNDLDAAISTLKGGEKRPWSTDISTALTLIGSEYARMTRVFEQSWRCELEDTFDAAWGGFSFTVTCDHSTLAGAIAACWYLREQYRAWRKNMADILRETSKE